MLGFIKKCFLTGLVFLSTLTSVNMLRCVSMNNQKCKVGPQIVNVNGDYPVFYFQYFLQLALEFSYFLYFHWYLKKDAIRIKFGTRTQIQFNGLMNGKSQTNRDQKLSFLFLQRHNQPQKYRIKLVKN